MTSGPSHTPTPTSPCSPWLVHTWALSEGHPLPRHALHRIHAVSPECPGAPAQRAAPALVPILLRLCPVSPLTSPPCSHGSALPQQPGSSSHTTCLLPGALSVTAAQSSPGLTSPALAPLSFGLPGHLHRSPEILEQVAPPPGLAVLLGLLRLPNPHLLFILLIPAHMLPLPENPPETQGRPDTIMRVSQHTCF